MKKWIYFSVFLLLVGCSSTELVGSWKNPDIKNFTPKKLVVVGMTQNLKARTSFEEKLTDQLSLRGVNSFKSLDVFKPEFTHSKKSEKEINEAIKILKDKSFDAVLVTVVKGVDENPVDYGAHNTIDYRFDRFKSYYYTYQDIYYQPRYYDEYKVYHVETSLYDIHSDNERTLIWTGYIDITDPSTIEKTIKDYINEVIRSLEDEQLINEL